MAASSPALDAGTVVGEITTSEEFAAFDPTADDGREVARGILVYPHPGGASPAVAVVANSLLAERATKLPSGISVEAKQAAYDALAAEHRIVIINDATGEPLASSWTLS
jgi:hypothetical protein